MDAQSWLDRWEQGQIGFHRKSTNPYLEKYLDQLLTGTDQGILVPLCGKTNDLIFLEKRAKTYGVELSDLAIRQFHEENERSFEVEERAPFMVYHSGNCSVLVGDFFALNNQILPKVSAIYDRAALIALPAEMRKEYVDVLLNQLESGGRMLLVSLEYSQDQMNGPPFSVPKTEVNEHFSAKGELVVLESRDIIADEPRFWEKGVTSMVETVYLFTRE